MRIDRFAPLAAVALAALLSGCTLIYDPDDVEAPPDRADVQAYVEAWLDAYLAGAATCLASSAEWAETMDMLSRAAYAARLMELWDRGVMEFDPASAEQCLALTRNAATCDEGSVTRNPGPTHPCAKALWGTKGLGEVCGTSPECAPPLFCDGGSGACPGLCAARAAEGATCGTGMPSCQRDLVCLGGYCRSRHLPQGAACTASEGICAFGLYCDAGTTHCEYERTSGGSCDGAACAMAYYCDTTLHCADRVPIGGACTVGAWSCVNGARCDGTGHCQEHAGLASSCGDVGDLGDWQDCLQSWCDGSTCVPFPERGDTATGPCAPPTLGIGVVGGVCSDYCP